MRKVALLVLATIVAWLPGLVQALGLGDIEVNSYLNQPLNAKIRLLSRPGEDLTDTRVTLASRQSFDRVGIDYQHTLRELRFSVEKDKKGSYIKVSTHKRVRDPFLNFLVEVNWARGRIQREYTLLIDPPTFTRAATPATQAPAVSRQVEQPRPAVAPARTTTRRAEPAVQPSYTGDSYTVGRNDTLWAIANKVKPSGEISTEQMMLALQNENPDAFIGQNINRMKAGYTLNIPGHDSITSMSQREARAEVRRQYRDWKQGRIGTAGEAAAAATGETGRLELLASDEAGVSAGGGAGGEGDQAATRKQLSLAHEAAEASRQENAELRSRIATLEQQIENVTRIASLKDEQLAALQKTLAELRAQEGLPAEEPVKSAEEIVAEEAAAPEEAAVPEEAAAERPDYGPQVEAKPATPGSPINQHAVEGYDPVDLDALPKTAPPAQPFKVPAAAPDAAEPAPAEEEPALTSLKDEMLGYFEEQPVVGAIVAVVIGFIVLVVVISMLRRKRENEDFQESILADTEMDTSIPISEELTLESDETLISGETQSSESLSELDMAGVSQMSGFDISALDSVDAETAAAEADPMTEADVLMAYGRFQPAEAMIKEAIEQEPDREDLKLKLLEIYHAARNQDDFEREASAFQVSLGGQADPMWDKVVEMGKDLCPESVLFSGEAPTEETLVDGLEETLLDMQPVTTQQTPSPAVEDQEKTDTGGIPSEDLDFDLTSFEKEGGDDDETIVSDEVDEMDLDLDLSTGGAESGEQMASDLANELEDIADTMATGEFDLDKMAAAEGETSSEYDLGGTLEPTVEVHSEDIFDAGVSELDEVTTKLDLAKAYIDMGDPDGARSILDEVMEEGNDEQKKDAQSLLDQI